MKIVLIRHGKTEANEKHLYCGQTDIGLSGKGISELNELKKSIDYPRPEGMKIITSGLKRCEETLRIIYGDVPHVRDSAFREMHFGAFEMRSYEEMKDDPDYIAWISGDNEINVTPGGESGEIMKKRVLDALRMLISEGNDVIIFTHGGVIAAVMEYLFPEENKNRYEWQPGAGRGYVADLSAKTYTAV